MSCAFVDDSIIGNYTVIRKKGGRYVKSKMLKTDEMFLCLSIPLPPEQDSGLERSLMREGCKEPITTWNGVIIDGHKRYRFCMEEGIEFDVEETRFSSAEEAVSWVCRKRIPNYNKMTPAFRYLVGKLYTAQKQIYHAGKKLPEGNRPLRLDPGWDRVSYLVAIELHLHRATVALVKAPAQAQAMEKLLPVLTEKELAVYKRGRNTKTHAAPNQATVSEYHAATGLETLFGYLYLQGDYPRVEELFRLAMED